MRNIKKNNDTLTLISNLKEIGRILFELECSCRLGGRGDAKTIISRNTSFGDIIIMGKWAKPDLSDLENDLLNNSMKSITYQTAFEKIDKK